MDGFKKVFLLALLMVGLACGRAAEPEIKRLPTFTPTFLPAEILTPTPTETPEPTPLPLPTETPEPLPTDTPLPTETPEPLPTETFTPEPAAIQPTETAASEVLPVTPLPPPPQAPVSGSKVVIVEVNEQSEYVDLQNIGDSAQDLNGWHLLSEQGAQNCPLSGVLQPGQQLRIWAMAEDSGQGGFNCGFDKNIWNNSEPDAAVMYDAAGVEVSRKD